MKNVLFGAVLALQFLTRIPLPVNCPIDDKTLKWALRFYPMAGFVIGGFLYLLYLSLNNFIPLYLMTLILLTLWVFLTGGLHLDGVMDVADAVGSNGSAEKKIEILKDSRVGSFAVLAALFLLIWKFMLLYSILDFENENSGVYLIFIPVISRFQALLQLYLFEPFQKTGMAFYWKKHLSKLDNVMAACWLLPFIIFPVEFMVIFILQLFFSFLFGRWASSHFNGINGDTVGASIEGAELWNLAVLYSLLLSGIV
ncbi:adenosylcobinamide-GDP ribazoletransferase [Metabacillus idriensis]|uniref:adenosylcobinamide-GDP ribazoletransferase n=1 Tax=Metabacillus idriensis TaxID=324768 RepID=UPI00174E3858|nr:adenosylcobinamide-GDP ribazoletransferase [Metabacillus idriensis]